LLWQLSPNYALPNAINENKEIELERTEDNLIDIGNVMEDEIPVALLSKGLFSNLFGSINVEGEAGDACWRCRSWRRGWS